MRDFGSTAMAVSPIQGMDMKVKWKIIASKLKNLFLKMNSISAMRQTMIASDGTRLSP